MASSNQLTARVPDRHIESIRDLAEERGIRDTDAERAVVRAGLKQLGYIDDKDEMDSRENYLHRVRTSGMTLGTVGLIAIGYGLFGAASFRFIGFGLILSGFALIAGAEFAPAISDWLGEISTGGESA